VIGLSPVRDRVVASSELFNSSLFFGESEGFIGSSELLNSFKVVAQREREREIERERERTHTQTHTHTHTHTRMGMDACTHRFIPILLVHAR
jgi:hypothetical protein